MTPMLLCYEHNHAYSTYNIFKYTHESHHTKLVHHMAERNL